MPLPAMILETRPISDLRTHLPEIETRVKETGEPIVLVRNGAPALLVMDCKAYNEALARQRHVLKLREAEIEARYRDEAYSVEASRARIQAIAGVLEAAGEFDAAGALGTTSVSGVSGISGAQDSYGAADA